MLPAAACAAAAGAARAAHGDIAGFGDGVLHVIAWSAPLVAAVAIGIWSMAYPWRRTWLIVAAFALAVGGGAMAGRGAVAGDPAVDTLVVASVVLLGLLIFGSRVLSLPSALAIAIVFGAIHGFDHGPEAGASGAFDDYVVGLAVATLFLSIAGMGIGMMARVATRHGMRVAGAAVAAAGIWFAVGAG